MITTFTWCEIVSGILWRVYFDLGLQDFDPFALVGLPWRCSVNSRMMSARNCYNAFRLFFMARLVHFLVIVASNVQSSTFDCKTRMYRC
jgi:hypothetical protein